MQNFYSWSLKEGFCEWCSTLCTLEYFRVWKPIAVNHWVITRKYNCEHEVSCQRLAVLKYSILGVFKSRGSEKVAYSKSSFSTVPCVTN